MKLKVGDRLYSNSSKDIGEIVSVSGEELIISWRRQKIRTTPTINDVVFWLRNNMGKVLRSFKDYYNVVQ